MLRKTAKSCLALLLGISCLSTTGFIHMKATEQTDKEKIEAYERTLTNLDEVSTPASRGATPSAEQMAYYKDELSAFIHFGPNTFTGNEWGHGTPEEIKAFNPSELDTDQWVSALKKAGFKKVIITAKHHDGFQLWPSEYSQRNVKNSPFGLASEDQGDILARLSKSCTEMEMDMGLYLSPWDMGEPSYGEHVKVYRDDGELIMEVNADGSVAYLKNGISENTAFWGNVEVVKEDNDGTSLDPNGNYNEFYMNQLKEVLTNSKYGRNGQFKEIWMDGAKNDPRYQQYDLQEWWDLCRELEPGVLIFNNIGNDVRWVGNESGFSYDPIWPQVDSTKMWNDYNLGINSKPDSSYPSKLKIITKDGVKRWAYADSYEDGGYLSKGDPNGDKWSMPEADYSIIGDWFWKNKSPQSANDMTESYFQTVGNATPMLLNTPPNKKGLLEESYVKNMAEFRDILDHTFATNVVEGATAIATSTYENSPSYSAMNIVDDDYDAYWSAEEGTSKAELTVFLNEVKQFDLIDIKEYIPLGQNISSYQVEVRSNGKWQSFGKTSGTRKSKQTIGYQSILRDNTVNADAIRLSITGSYGAPKISGIHAYKMDERIEFSKGSTIVPSGLDFVDAHSAKTTGSWDKRDADTARINSMYSNDANATATYTFTGSRFFLSSRYSPNFGGIKVSVDHQEPVIVNLNDPTPTISSIVYASDTLPQGEHTITLQPVMINGKMGMASDGLFYLNNEATGMFELEQTVIDVEESQAATVIVKRMGGSQGEASVRLSTSPGTAVHGRHYESVNTVLNFANGEIQKEVILPTIDNDETTGTLFYTATLSDVTNAMIGFYKQATINIEDNEVDTSELQKAIETAKQKNQENYSEAIWMQLQEAIINAEIFLSSEHLKQRDVDEYVITFNKTIASLREKGSYAQLDLHEPVLFEAEDGDLENGATFFSKTEHPNFANLSGRGMVGELNGGRLTVYFDAPKAGTYTMDIAVYSGGLDLLYFTNGETGEKAIEGSKQIPFNGGGGSVKTVSVDIHVPEAGMNHLTFSQKAGAANHPNMDAITFTYKYVEAKEITMTPDKAMMLVGDTLSFDTRITPENASDPSVTWSVNHEEVATINETGILSAIETGSVIVTATTKDGPSASAVVIVQANVEPLTTKLKAAKELQSAGYTNDSYANLQACILDAEDILKIKYVTQHEVDEVLQRLTQAMDQLEVKQDKLVLKDTLNTATTQYQALPTNLNNIVKDNFTNALEGAKAVMNQTDVSMTTINQANATLSSNLQMLSFLSDYKILDQTIEKATEIQKHLDQYEDSNKPAFVNALQEAQLVRGDDLSIDEDIMKAATTLQKAMDQLVPVTGSESVQKQILKSAVNKALDIKEKNLLDGLAERVVAYFNVSLDRAIHVLQNEQATPEELMLAWSQLSDAMHYLDFKADKTKLSELVLECKAIDLTQYKEEGKTAFKTALEQGRFIIGCIDVLDVSIQKAYEDLLQAKNNLILLEDQLDKTILHYMIQNAQHVFDQPDYYEQDENWEMFTSAFSAAQTAYESAATQSEVNYAVTTLANAYENIRLIANEERLQALHDFVTMVEHCNLTMYSEEHVTYMQEALAYANALIDRDGFTQADYAVFEEMQATITYIVDQQHFETITPEETETDVTIPTTDSTTEHAINQPVKGTAKTGDQTNTGLLIGAILIAGTAVGTLKRRNKKTTK